MSGRSDELKDGLVQILWSLWNELGVAGVGRLHSEHLIDPEPLIVATAWIGSQDARLRDESIDWCCRYGRFISGTRLRNIARTFPPPVQESFGRYAATVSANSSERWGANATPLRMKLSGRSFVDRFDSAATLKLRIRGLTGVGVRSEILALLLFDPHARVFAADIASATGFTRRNVADELDALRLANVVSVTARGKRSLYSLKSVRELESLVGPVPLTFAPWWDVFTVIVAGIHLIEARRSEKLQSLEAHKLVHDLADRFARSRLDPPISRGEPDALALFTAWLSELVRGLANPQSAATPWQLWRRPTPFAPAVEAHSN